MCKCVNGWWGEWMFHCTQWADTIDEIYGARKKWADCVVLSMMTRAFPHVRLIVHKPGCPVLDDTPMRRRVVRIFNTANHFMSLRPMSELQCQYTRGTSENILTSSLTACILIQLNF